MADLKKVAEERAANNSFMNYVHVELVTLEEERSVCRLPVSPEVCNGLGMIHGGAIYTLADNAAGYAAHSDGRKHVTQNSSMHFLRNITEGAALASATVRHRGRATCLVNVDITAESGGKLLATGEFTFFCLNRQAT